MILVCSDVCELCGTCVAVCPTDAIEITTTELLIIEPLCIKCNNCIHICPLEAMTYNEVSV